MSKLRLTYPVIRHHQIEINITEQEAADILGMPAEQQARYMNDQNDALDLPEQTNARFIQSALENDYASIKRVRGGEGGL